MDKKQLLIHVIQKLQGTRELADGILALLQKAEIDEQVIDTLIKIINQAVKSTQSKQKKSILEQSITQLQKIHDLEEADKESEEEIEHILDTIQ